MVKRCFLVGVMLLAFLLVISCGVPQEEHDAVLAERDAIQAEVASLQSDLAATESDLAVTESDLAATQSQISSLNSHLAAAQSQISSVQNQISSLQTNLAAAKARIAQLEAMAVSRAYVDKIYATPDYMQTDLAYGGLPGGGRQYCAPVSVSNSLMWLSDNGFPNLTPHTDDRKADQFDVAHLLGQPSYMNTSLENGTGVNKLARGIKKFILDKGYTYERLEFQGWRYIDSEFDTGEDAPNVDWVKYGILGYGFVWLNVGWYTYDSVTDEYTRIGGHWITLVGYGHDGRSSNPDYLIAHDPASRAGTTFANEYILPVRITSGTLKGSYSGLPRSAVGFYKMTDGMHLWSHADFGILDAVIVLVMQP